MNTYQIKNITDTLEKRNPHYNTDVIIPYVDKMISKTIKIKPGLSVYFVTDSLSVSVYRLRLMGLVSIISSPNLGVKKEKKVKKKKSTPIKKTTKKQTSSSKTKKQSYVSQKPISANKKEEEIKETEPKKENGGSEEKDE